jgi:hypothetical protein
MEVNFKSCNIESLLSEISNYSCAQANINANESAYSYMKGVQLILDNLLTLYDAAKSSIGGQAKIYALNCTVNKKLLSSFFKEIKKDLGIDYAIFNGGELNLPIASELSNKILQNYSTSVINPHYFILGVKKTAKVIDYAYNAPLTKPFKPFIDKEAKPIVEKIKSGLNEILNP